MTGKELHKSGIAPQHMENGFETKKITEAIFVDLSAVYDTINHKKLKLKVDILTLPTICQNC